MMNSKHLFAKIMRLFFAVLTIAFSFLDIMPVFAATTTGKTTANVKVRAIPGTGYTATELGTISNGTIITITDTVPTSDNSSGCTTGLWNQISYNGGVGYVCTAYVTTSFVEEYDRPWTSPKKAIVGGAKYIYKYYVATGQYNSYLKKFNVNPNSTYSVYTHQYMTNVRAPYFEARTSYLAYQENNLLEKPLVFTIPVFENMPEEYTYLPGDSANNDGQAEVTDTTFEALLDAQGFPESYKKKLRLLHNAYPAWVFESLKTTLDWNTAVNAEQPVSYVDGSNVLLRALDGNGNYILKEGSTWYLANTQTTAYFLDPRNFLNVERILMFEKLSYSPIHTEAIVQSLLNSTFMAGNSALDNQSYAGIFVEAAQTANVSAIYLASLAIQESGVSGSMATTGAQFTYNNVTYQGLYNFFNIGAKSSESSPIRAGLVWANAGSAITVVGGGGTVPTDELVFFNNLGLSKISSYIRGISVEKSLSAIKNQLPSITLTVTNASGNTLSGDDKIGTGSRMAVTDGTNTFSGTVVILGDISGDGSINAIDLLYMRKYLLNTVNLTDANLEAAKIAKNGSVGAADLLYLRKYLLDSETYKIVQ